jgi:hypothetical protein
MLTLTKYNNNEYILDIYTKVEKLFGIDEKEIGSLDDVLSCKHKKANLFITFIVGHIEYFKINEQEEKNISAYDVDYSPLKEKYSLDVLERILIDLTQYVSSDAERVIESFNPYFKLIETIRLTPWQWYSENEISSTLVESLYLRLTNLKVPFGDDRFKALPVHVDCYRKGNNRSEWLRNENGGINTYYNEKTNSAYQHRDKTCYNGIFIDAKIGIVIFFKDKPSITISFNFDNDKNLYIHQIQAQPKDRGHYKVKGDWQTECINYIKSLFPEFKLHLISGKDISEMVSLGYQSDTMPECMKISPNTISRIKENYDKLMSHCSNWVKKGDVEYRKLYD